MSVNVVSTIPTSKNEILQRVGKIQNVITNLEDFATYKEKQKLKDIQTRALSKLSLLFSSPELAYDGIAREMFEMSAELAKLESKIEQKKMFYFKKD